MRPQLWVSAEPNGAGKSTLVQKRKLASRIPVVNPDDIARDLSGHSGNDAALMLRAGRLAAIARQAHIGAKRSFALETTLSGHSEMRVMASAREAGYKVNLVYVGLDDELASLTRVRERVRRGGHDVSPDDIQRRYAKSIANLSAAMRLADRSFVVDNSSGRHRLLMVVEKGRVRGIATELPPWAIPFIER
jgi:predicted ABC-type ATPase